ncbi:hypothetical protein Rsub_10929 [Raphidocelis subcapitata]|uniref:Uncharacterized protein n=1 Tax=Raphidocelis subcapitata TaxID=307507 RepID=A0A2V0PEK0_9CHLO|nr:hypothetical protein Rsub_10929 [Raphidocelis subcapitata]|eukprot:GBF98266.1 hypothetical protein Rsub_10929 [Raphidocelis subcapitata]
MQALARSAASGRRVLNTPAAVRAHAGAARVPLRRARCSAARAAPRTCGGSPAHDGPSTSGSEVGTNNSSGSSSSGAVSRRGALAAALLALGGAAAAPRPARAELAGITLDDALESQLPGGPPASAELPRAYQQTVKQLARALREALDTEAAGAKEFEVRRKADPAKDLAKQFMRRWQDDPRVAGDATHDEMKLALSELGGFYQKNGPRSRLTEEAAAGVRAHLDAVEAALPPEAKGILGL